MDDHRMRVEHCCYVTPPILNRIKKLGVVDSSATGFMYDLGDAYVANRGEAAMQHMWPHRDLIDAGIPAPGHSDSYVCTPNPFVALWAMVNRQSESGGSLDSPGAPSQAVTVEEALRAYTTWSAYASFREDESGVIEPGRWADLTVMNIDPFVVTDQRPGRLLSGKILMTIVGGEVVYDRKGE